MKRIFATFATITFLLTGCSSSLADKMPIFVEEERTAVTYEEYQGFLDKYSGYISEDLLEDFSLRLLRKPTVAENTSKCMEMCYGSDSGLFLYYDAEYMEYYLVVYRVEDSQIVEYTVTTLYELR